MYERFTEQARRVFILANDEAQQLHHEYIATEHLLLGLIRVESDVTAKTFKKYRITQEKIRSEILKIIQPGLRARAVGRLPQTPRVKKAIEYSMEESRQLGHHIIDTEHILLGLIRENEGVAAQLLRNLGLQLGQVRQDVLDILGQAPAESFAEVSEHSRNKDSTSSVFRILDAAANRAAEGLRVVEDFCRFALDDRYLTKSVKVLRHELSEALTALPRSDRHASRETQQDVGTTISTPAEAKRADAVAVCEASCERVKQSLRSLEEFSKVTAPNTAAKLEALRYRFYTLEKALTNRLRLSGSALEIAKLCVLVDGSFTESLTRELIAAGVGMIQLREKNLTDRELLDRARQLRELCHSPMAEAEGCLFIINDRADIAAAANADGVHLGQDDLSVKAAREILGPRKIIGVSTHNIEQARQAVLDGTNYIGVGPTFPSATKRFEVFPGTAFLKQVAEEISLPAFAIGGITLENLDEVLATGINRVAVSGAIAKAEEPGEVAREFASRLR